MTITNTWKVVQMDAYPEFETASNYVFKVHWSLTATDESGNTGYVYGSANLLLDPQNGYTPYADLTEAEVIGWVTGALGAAGVAAHKATAAQNISPPVIKLALPWA